MDTQTKKQESASLAKLNRLTNYLAVAQVFLKDNFLLEEKLKPEDIKKRLLGHWGTCPGINYVQAQTNRQIIQGTGRDDQRDFLYTVGPGHGFPAYQANIFLDGSLSHFYPEKIPYTKDGLFEIIRNFSTPFGYPSHLNPEAPGALLEGGELGYSLAVAAGSVLDNPDMVNVCLVGDGEAEAGPLAASWNINKFLSPKSDGAVLPVLHVNGYKISGPTVFGRMHDSEIKKYFNGLGYKVYFIDAGKKKDIHIQGMEVFDKAMARIRKIQEKARRGEKVMKPEWPVIILKTPKGMSGPTEVDGKKVTGNHLSHQVVFEDVAENVDHLKILDDWLASYNVAELISFGKNGEVILDSEIQSMIPEKDRALGMNPAANGQIENDLQLPQASNYFVEQKAGEEQKNIKKENSMFLAGQYLRDVMGNNETVRLFSPDETYSNRLHSVFETTKRQWQWPVKGHDKDFGTEGKVIEILSEHVLFGMLWGYTLSGRSGYFVTYEAFGQIIASMADQYVKFLHASEHVDFRGDVPSLNIMLSSLLERQDHNGYSHQNPSLIANNLDRDSDLVNVYFPVDKNMMVHAMEKTLTSKNCLNIIVAGKKVTRTWLTKKQAEQMAENEVGIFDFISDKNPDVVMATAGDYVTEEAVIGTLLFKERFPNVAVQFVNFFKLDILAEKNTKTTREEMLDRYLTRDKGVVFNYHGYPASIKKLLFDYHVSERTIVNGYEEEGSTTTPFDMKSRNGLSRFHVVKDLAQMAAVSGTLSEEEVRVVSEEMDNFIEEEKRYITEHKVDPEYIKKWSV